MKTLKIAGMAVFAIMVLAVVLHQTTVKSSEVTTATYWVEEIDSLVTYPVEAADGNCGVFLANVVFKATFQKTTVTENDFSRIELHLTAPGTLMRVDRVIETRSSAVTPTFVSNVGRLYMPLDIFNGFAQSS